MLTVLAPAKINLTLEVLGERPDGYHQVRGVTQTIDLCDRLSLRSADDVTIRSDSEEFIVGESLVPRAAGLLREALGYSKGASIEITKRIPFSAGLGGDSSAAAAALRGLNRLWGSGLSLAELAALSSRLGSDVPFFVYGGTALVEGRGERVTPLQPLPPWWVLLVVPALPRPREKTRMLYAALRPPHFTDGRITGRLVRALAGGSFEPSLLLNTFENVAFTEFPGLEVYRQHLVKLGAPHVHLAGSGPALFSLFKDKAQAEDLYTRCRQQGLESYLARTIARTPKD